MTVSYIEDTTSLASLCVRLAQDPYVTVDTEFIRERTYWPQVCLIQIAGANEHALIDPLAEGIDLSPLWNLMVNPHVLKVFHAARQDLEIILYLSGTLPTPLYDTQVAAMVCGFGEQVGYETLVQRLANTSIDKSHRYTDWSRRPLTQSQLDYALSDVTHLRTIYEALERQIQAKGRGAWVSEELERLQNPSDYTVVPDDAWRRLKPRQDKPVFLSVLRELAAWREQEAQASNKPRGRIVRDDTLTELAATTPRSAKELERVRGLSTHNAHNSLGQTLLSLIEKGQQRAQIDPPSLPRKPVGEEANGVLLDMLKALLKDRAEQQKVAPRLVASSADLEAFIRSEHNQQADIGFLSGWRFDLFGADALKLKSGEAGLVFAQQKLRIASVRVIPHPEASTSPIPDVPAAG